MNRSTLVQVVALSGIVLANFIAQGFYYFRLYYTPQHPLPDLRSALALGSVLVLFLAGLALLALKRKAGYYLTALFLLLEFMFYLGNLIGEVIHGYGLFFHLANPDPILRAVFAIGYLNFFAAGYFLFLLLRKRRELVRVPRE